MVFGARCAKRYGSGISMALVQISQHFRKNKMAANKIWTFFGFRVLGNTFFCILYDLGYILHSPKLLLYLYFSVASPKVLTLS